MATKPVYVVVELWSSEWNPNGHEATIRYAGPSKRTALKKLAEGDATPCNEGSWTVECKRYGGKGDWHAPYYLRADGDKWRLEE